MGAQLELFLLDHRKSDDVIALGRRGADTAIEHIAIDGELKQLADFGHSLGAYLTGNHSSRPTPQELMAFGGRLFNFLFRGALKSLYDRLPVGAVSLQILSDRPDIKAVPWEFLVAPDRMPSPHRDRSVVRVQPTCGIDHAPQSRINGKKLRVLFVSADPVDQAGVEWTDVMPVYERALGAHLPAELTVKVIPGATRDSLIAAVAQKYSTKGQVLKQQEHQGPGLAFQH